MTLPLADAVFISISEPYVSPINLFIGFQNYFSLTFFLPQIVHEVCGKVYLNLKGDKQLPSLFFNMQEKNKQNV